MNEKFIDTRIGLALSGGGVRAMAFHCGVLRWLAETDQLENITHISSVSGGSLFTGLVFKINNWSWPTSAEYQNRVLPKIREVLLKTSLQFSGAVRLTRPDNWRFILSRANVIAQTIENKWGVTNTLADLPEIPEWSINGTTAENGRRFRFKQKMCGDYELGYAEAKNFKVSEAMAMSAAFPLGIGPLALNPSDYKWKKRRSWNGPSNDLVDVDFPFKRLHLYDGGVYDNLGLEPLFDMGKREFKGNVNYVVVSDAGAPLKRGGLGFVLNPRRATRLANIVMDQVRALRVRSFVNFMQENKDSGAYIQIGTDARSTIYKYRSANKKAADQLLKELWQYRSEASAAAKYPTNLRKMARWNYFRLEQHGYETAKWNSLLFNFDEKGKISS